MIAIRGLPGLGKLPELGEMKPERLPAIEPIVVKPQPPGEAPDVLEKAALQGVTASLPERIIWKWLLGQPVTFERQVYVLGGRQAGGAVLDFVVQGWLPAKPVAIRVQGDYWHSADLPGRPHRDDEQAGRLREIGYHVVDLLEADIYSAVQFDTLGDYVLGRVYA